MPQRDLGDLRRVHRSDDGSTNRGVVKRAVVHIYAKEQQPSEWGLDDVCR